MKRITLLASMLPTLAMAHPGHGGLGLFHHAMDVVLMMLLVGAIAAGMYWYNKR